MTESNTISSLLDRMVARWPVIAIALVVGLLAGAAFGYSTKPDPGYTASVTVRYVAPSGVPGAPTADTFVAMALDASVQTTAAAQAGVDPSAYTDAVSAALNPRDKSLIVIAVTNPDEATAITMATALSEAARLEALVPADRYADLYRGRLERNDQTIEMIQQRIESLETQLQGELSSTDRIALEGSMWAEQLRLQATQETKESNLFTLSSYDYTAQQMGEVATESAEQTQYIVSGALRGGAVGLFLGLLLAGVFSLKRTDAT